MAYSIEEGGASSDVRDAGKADVTRKELQNTAEKKDKNQNEGSEAVFRGDQGGALLGVEIPFLQPQIEFQGKTFIVKPEFHVTMVGFAAKLDKRYKEAAKARGETVSNSQAAEKVKEALNGAAEGMTFRVQLGEELRRATKGEAETIIKMCDVDGIEEYLHKVESALDLESGSIEHPPTHTTVYTLENGQGIGIANQQQFNELTTVLSPEEADGLRKKAVVK